MVEIDKMLLEAWLLMEKRMSTIVVQDCSICKGISVKLERAYGCIKLQEEGCSVYVV